MLLFASEVAEVFIEESDISETPEVVFLEVSEELVEESWGLGPQSVKKECARADWAVRRAPGANLSIFWMRSSASGSKLVWSKISRRGRGGKNVKFLRSTGDFSGHS